MSEDIHDEIRALLLTKADLARILQISTVTLDRQHRLGIGCPRIKLGNSRFVRYRVGDVQKYLKKIGVTA